MSQCILYSVCISLGFCLLSPNCPDKNSMSSHPCHLLENSNIICFCLKKIISEKQTGHNVHIITPDYFWAPIPRVVSASSYLCSIKPHKWQTPLAEFLVLLTTTQKTEDILLGSPQALPANHLVYGPTVHFPAWQCTVVMRYNFHLQLYNRNDIAFNGWMDSMLQLEIS